MRASRSGLPSGYNRDFHEDKEILVETLNLLNKAVQVIPSLITTTTINVKRMEELAGGNFANATELANYLVAKHNVPFREAHDIVGYEGQEESAKVSSLWV
jgi:argininosuccinate lyase